MAQKKPAAKKAAPRSTKKFLRNATGVEVSLRLERQERPKKRHELKPRGQRGDLVLLQKDDISDPVVTENVALGVVEIITEAEAKEVIERQSTNQQTAVHPSLSSIKNELGEPIDKVTLEAQEADRGTVVANLEDGQLASQGPGINWERARMENPNPGHEQPMRSTTVNPAQVPAEGVTQAEVADAAARSKSNQSAQDLGLKVSVEPTQKT